MGYFSYGLKGTAQGVFDKIVGIPVAAAKITGGAVKKVTPGLGDFRYDPNENRALKDILSEGLKEKALDAKVKTVKGVMNAPKAVYNGAKKVGKGVAFGAKAVAAPILLPGAAYRFTKQSIHTINHGSPALRAGAAVAIGGGAYYGGNIMQQHIDKRNQLMALENGASDYFKAASVDGIHETERDIPNIPRDTSTPNSNQPQDSVDYFDFQEWANSDQPYPDRGDGEVTRFVTKAQKTDWDTRKVASVLGVDASVALALEDYVTDRVRMEKTSGIGDKIIDTAYDSGMELLRVAGKKAPEMTDDYIRNTPVKEIAKRVYTGVKEDAQHLHTGAKFLASSLAAAGGVAASGAKVIYKNKGYIPYIYAADPYGSVSKLFKRPPTLRDNAKLIAGIGATSAAAGAAANYYSEGGHEWTHNYMNQ